MPHHFFDPSGMQQLSRVYDQVKKALEEEGAITPVDLDLAAARLLRAAAEGIHDEEALLRAALGSGFRKPQK